MRLVRMIVVSHSHWDREWYLSFQQFRARLVEMMDTLLALLEREPRFVSFTLDGQTIPLEDYLEVRPEKRAEIRERVREGRLLVGPWYTSPDEFLISAEALIRNLLLGHRIAAEFGEVMKVGYLPDSFGQMAQLPQILRGFGIRAAVFWRGAGDEPNRTEFHWRAPDGTTVLAVHLPQGYGNPADLPLQSEALIERLAGLRKQPATGATTDHLLLMNGGDQKYPQEDLPQVLALANDALEHAALAQGTLLDYIAAVEKTDLPLPIIQGDLRSAKYAYLLPGTLSSRMPLKQSNAAAQTLLEKWAEPFSAWAGLLGHPYPQGLLRQAWKYVLQNQAHDSICGCIIDAVQRDMKVRFAWAEEIGKEATRQSLQSIAGSIDTTSRLSVSPELAKSSPKLMSTDTLIPVIVFNPSTISRSDAVAVSFQPLASLEERAFIIADGEGLSKPYELLSGKPQEILSADASRAEFAEFMQMIEGGEVFDLRITSLELAPLGPETVRVTATLVKKESALEVDFRVIKQHIHTILEDKAWMRFSVKAYFAPQVQLSFLAEDIPACGYKTYWVISGGQCQSESNSGRVTSDSPFAISNEFYTVEANPTDGTLTITDRNSGLVYDGCNHFVDDGEAGDLYWHESPSSDEVVGNPEEAPRITVEKGPLGATLRVEMEYSLPIGITEDRQARSEDRVSCPIVSRIRLCSHTRRIDIYTEVVNQANNHRLRVHFPTPIATEHSCAEGAFGTVKRSVEIPSGEGWVERPVGTHPQGSFVVASDRKNGLMIINRGLPEYEFLREKEGVTVALTLLRCADRLSPGAEVLTPLAQCRGRTIFEYALLPHSGDWQEANLYHGALAFNAPLQALVTDSHTGALPRELAFAAVEPPSLVVSAIKAAVAGDGLILRLYNPTPQEVEATVHIWRPFVAAELVRMDEQSIAPISHRPDGAVIISVTPNRAETVRFSFEEG